MLKKTLQFIVALSLIVFSVCTFAIKADDVTAKKTNVYLEDNPNFLITSSHPEFVIKLKSNPTTGYSWFLRDYDANLIAPKKHNFEKPEKGLIGAPGYEVWTFRIKPAGFIVPQQTTIRFIYTRPWQGADSATQVIFRVTMEGK